MPTNAEIHAKALAEGWLAGNIHVDEPLNLHEEVRRFRRDPLEPLLERLGDSDAMLFRGGVGRYSDGFVFYTLALERVLQHISIGRRFQNEVRYFYGGRRRFTKRQKEISRKCRECARFSPLDFNTYLISARILLDRTIALSRRFLKGSPKLPSFTSFGDHKKFLSKHPTPWGMSTAHTSM